MFVIRKKMNLFSMFCLFTSIYCGSLKQPLFDNSLCQESKTIIHLFKKYYLLGHQEAQLLYTAVDILNEIDEKSYEHVFSYFPHKMIPYDFMNVRKKKSDLSNLLTCSTKKEAAKLINSSQILINSNLIMGYPSKIDTKEAEKSRLMSRFILDNSLKNFQSVESDQNTVKNMLDMLIPQIPLIFGPLYRPDEFYNVCCTIS